MYSGLLQNVLVFTVRKWHTTVIKTKHSCVTKYMNDSQGLHQACIVSLDQARSALLAASQCSKS